MSTPDNYNSATTVWFLLALGTVLFFTSLLVDSAVFGVTSVSDAASLRVDVATKQQLWKWILLGGVLPACLAFSVSCYLRGLRAFDVLKALVALAVLGLVAVVIWKTHVIRSATQEAHPTTTTSGPSDATAIP